MSCLFRNGRLRIYGEAASQEYRRGEFYGGEMAKVSHVKGMTCNRGGGKEKREAIDQV